MQNGLNKKIALAAKWSGITEIVAKLVLPVTNMALARLLTPEDFGIVATLTLVVSFAEIFADAGFQKYLVQHNFADKNDLNSTTNVIFWSNLIFSFVLWGIIALFISPIAAMIGAAGYETPIIIMCAQIPLQAFSSIQTARFRRELDFKSLFQVRIITTLIPLVITVPLALVFHNFWALVFGTLTRDVMNALLLMHKTKWKPQWIYNFKKLKDIIGFSLWTILENVTIWLTGNIGILIVSSNFSSYYLGLYRTSISTVNSYMNIITAATAPVLFSALSRYQDDPIRHETIFLRFQSMVALLLLPLGFGAYIFQDLITTILLGSQWLEAAEFIGLWSLTNALATILGSYNSEVFRSKGYPYLSVLVQAIHLAMLVPMLLIAKNNGYREITLIRSLARLCYIPVSLLVLRVTIGYKIITILKNLWPIALSTFIMSVTGILLRSTSSGIISQIASIVLCIIVYGMCMLIIPAGRRLLAEINLLEKTRQKIICLFSRSNK